MNLQTFTNRPILSFVISALIVLFGLVGLYMLPIEQFPEIAPPTIRVSTTYTGANAATLQKAVIAPLEQAINGIEGIDYITSNTNSQGDAVITIHFRHGISADMAAVNVQNRISTAQGSLPPEVITSGILVQKSQNNTARIIALYSPTDQYDQAFLYNYLRIQIEPQLSRLKGVGDITVFGSDYALRIWLDPVKMGHYHLMPDDIGTLLNEQNRELSLGNLGSDADNTFQYTLNYAGRQTDIADFGNLIIRSQDNGEIIRLKDVAEIELGSLTYATRNQLNGHPGANCMIAQAPGANANEIVAATDKALEDIRRNLPEGMEIIDLMNVKHFMDVSIRNVTRTLAESILLVIIVILFFLRDGRAGLIPIVSIGVSVMGTFGFLWASGFSLNMLTLFALVLAIGTVVDDSIVVVEAVQARIDNGDNSAKQATYIAMHNVSNALIATTLVFIAVFIPICFIQGTTGIFYRQFSLTIAASVVISTLNALTLSPAMCALLMHPKTPRRTTNKSHLKQRIEQAYSASFRQIGNKYKTILAWLLHHPSVTLLSISTAAILSAWLLQSSKTGFVPEEDTGTVVVDVQTAPGSSLATTDRIMQCIEQRLQEVPQINAYSKSTGLGMLAGQASCNGTFIIRLKHWDDRKGKDNTNKAVIAQIYQRLTDIEGARIMVFAQPIIAGYGVTNGFEVNIQDRSGNNNGRLQQVTDNFIQTLTARPEIARAQSNANNRYPQYTVSVDFDRCKRYGVSPSDVENTLSVYTGGQYVSNLNLYTKVYRIIVQAAAHSRSDETSLRQMYVRAANGAMLPLYDLVHLQRTEGCESLGNFNLFPSIAVNGMPADGYSSGQVITAIRETAEQVLPSGYGYDFGGMTREEVHSKGNNHIVFGLCILFVYLILCALYESMLIPLAIIGILPLGLAGCYGFARLSGIENNIYMQMGAIMLIGLLAKTAILLTEYASTLHKEGLNIPTAALKAASIRLRPILMTSITMLFGLLPLLFAQGVGCNSSRSLGTGVIGGMLIGTIAILIFVPALYCLLQYIEDNLKQKIKKRHV
ncbi:MAG: efflux RND transporter permease subunit [Paludibacter sp.]|nr:efflux RND transporter permease subunit [Bacteroidales bacterium]MCM1068855.1 efflux RND transporter permease subunit [Prevotella sp.]MCM1353116.1 efflux RND transporter permease subunit [Bacteroides sp.]MCM1442438.1 efflux RND transporter permease subunit [Muribaculum sp.]MCM1481281.1 efflux RND transporter permease subunit [Paludibacter sp.]